MRNRSLLLVPAIGLIAAHPVVQSASAQSRPAVLFIAREVEKVGHSGAHMKFEAEWAAALVRAGMKTPSLGMVSTSGPAEGWWVTGFPSFEALGAAYPPAVAAVMEKYSMLDAAHIDSWRGMTAVYRPDLSYGEPANLVEARGMDITTWRIRPGHDEHFAEAAKTYFGIMKRAGITTSSATYQVRSGAPTGTYLIFAAMRSMADIDKGMMDDPKIAAAMTQEEGAALNKFLSDAVISMETNSFRIDPNITIAPEEMIKADPKFWTPSWKKMTPAAPAKPSR